MARPKKVSPSPAVIETTVHDRIRAAEKSLLSGATERVLVSDSDLETIAGLILDSGSTKAQLLKKAVHLGLQVLVFGKDTGTTPGTATIAYEEAFDNDTTGGWVKPEPIPYAGFELRRPAGRHEPVEEPTTFTAEPQTLPEEGVV